MTSPRRILIAFAALATLALPRAAGAGPKTDIVTLANGDRITGEIKLLQRGQLQFSTDDAGTIKFEWDKIVTVQAPRLFEVVTTDGRRFLGSLGQAPARAVVVVEAGGSTTLTIGEVTGIKPLGTSFWKMLDGALDAGFNYTRSSDVAQANISSDTVFRKPGFALEVRGAATVTYQGDADDQQTNQSSAEAAYHNYRGRNWFVGGGGRVESNESLGITLRTQASGLTGYRLVNSNRAYVWTAGGIGVNKEKGVDTGSTENVEATFGFSASYYSYDRPKTNIDTAFQYYASLSNFGRQRLQLDTAIKRELWSDFFIGLQLYDTFDSDPPNPDALHNDIGIVASIGWTYGR